MRSNAYYDDWYKREHQQKHGEEDPLKKMWDAFLNSDAFYFLEREWLANYLSTSTKDPWVVVNRGEQRVDIQMSACEYDIFFSFSMEDLFLEHLEDHGSEERKLILKTLKELIVKIEAVK